MEQTPPAEPQPKIRNRQARKGITTSEIMDALGGTVAASVRLKVLPSSISNWRNTGIPHRYWPEVVRAAREVGLNGLTFEKIEAAYNANRSVA